MLYIISEYETFCILYQIETYFLNLFHWSNIYLFIIAQNAFFPNTQILLFVLCYKLNWSLRTDRYITMYLANHNSFHMGQCECLSTYQAQGWPFSFLLLNTGFCHIVNTVKCYFVEKCVHQCVKAHYVTTAWHLFLSKSLLIQRNGVHLQKHKKAFCSLMMLMLSCGKLLDFTFQYTGMYNRKIII